MKYIISETGEFPPQYKVLQEGENGICNAIMMTEKNSEFFKIWMIKKVMLTLMY